MEALFELGKTTAFLKPPFTENNLFYFCTGISILEPPHMKQKGWTKTTPHQQFNDHKPKMNLNLFVLTQPICVILRLFTASLHNTVFLARHEETQWLSIREMECFAVTCTRASEGRRISHLLRFCRLYTCRQGVQSCPSDARCHVRLQLYHVCNCSASLLKLNRQREGLIFHRISAVTLSSSSPYLGWIKCTMNLYSKWTGK